MTVTITQRPQLRPTDVFEKWQLPPTLWNQNNNSPIGAWQHFKNDKQSVNSEITLASQRLQPWATRRFVNKANTKAPHHWIVMRTTCHRWFLLTNESVMRETPLILWQLLNTLWCNHGDINPSTLTRVMACRLTEPNHYLNQCWLIIGKVQWQLSEGNLIYDTSAINY